MGNNESANTYTGRGVVKVSNVSEVFGRARARRRGISGSKEGYFESRGNRTWWRSRENRNGYARSSRNERSTKGHKRGNGRQTTGLGRREKRGDARMYDSRGAKIYEGCGTTWRSGKGKQWVGSVGRSVRSARISNDRVVITERHSTGTSGHDRRGARTTRSRLLRRGTIRGATGGCRKMIPGPGWTGSK